MTRQVIINLAARALLLVQYLLGMVVNFYVDLPDHHPGRGRQRLLLRRGPPLWPG